MRWNTKLACLPLASLALAGCGGSGSSTPKLDGKPDPAALRVGQAYIDAYVAKKPAVICRLIASTVRAQLGGAACPKTVRSTLVNITFPKLRAQRSYVKGNTATVTFKGVSRQVTLTRENGAWRVINGGT